MQVAVEHVTSLSHSLVTRNVAALAAIVLVLFLRIGAAAAGHLTFVETIHDAIGLENTGQAVLSSDGAHLYVWARGDDGIGVLARDATTGALAFTSFADGASGGIVAPGRFALSPDGVHLYATAFTSASDQAVVVFERDPGSGALTLVDVYESGVDGFVLHAPSGITLSPDGLHVYVGATLGSILIFARSPGTGALTFVDVVQTGVDGVTFGTPSDAVFSPDGTSFYVTSGAGLTVFSRDSGTGLLTFVDDERSFDPTYDQVRVSPDGAHVYLTRRSSFVQDIRVYDRDPSTGAVALVQTVDLTVFSNFFGARLAMSPDGGQLYAQRESGSTLLVFDRASVTGLLTHAATVGGGGVSDGGAPVISLDGAHLYVPTGHQDGVLVYQRDTLTGALTLVQNHTAALGSSDGLDDVQDVLVTSDGAFIYTLAPGDDGVGLYERDPVTGLVTFVETFVPTFSTLAGFVLSPDERHLYVTAGSITHALARDAASGTLTVAAPTVTHDVPNPASAISPSGSYLYLAGDRSHDSSISVYARSAADGALTLLQSFTAISGSFLPARALVALDGRTLYVAGREDGDDAIAAYDLDPTSGLVTGLLQVIRAGARDGLDLGDRTNSLVLSPDGRHLYAGSTGDGAVAVFDRLVSGALDYAQAVTEGLDSVGRGLAVAPSGGYLYVPHGGAGGGVAVLWRDATSGRLTFLEKVESGVGGVSGLAGAGGLAVSADGAHLYVTASRDDSLATFALDRCTPVGRARVLLARIASDLDPTNDVLKIKGEFLVGGGGFGSLDLASHGLRLVVESTTGTPRVDVTLPMGVFGGSGTAGWLLNGAGTKWTYKDKTGTPVNGIVKVSVLDRSTHAPGLVRLVLKGTRGTYPVTSGDEPVQARVELGRPAPCARTLFGAGDCTFNEAVNKVKCK